MQRRLGHERADGIHLVTFVRGPACLSISSPFELSSQEKEETPHGKSTSEMWGGVTVVSGPHFLAIFDSDLY